MLALTETEFKQSRLYQSIKQEGIEEGRQEALMEIATRLLQQGFGVEEVAQILNLQIEQVRQLTDFQSESQ